MKKVCVVTGTRAEYGLLKGLIVRLSEESDIATKLVVTGAHLSQQYGMTLSEIEKDNIKIDKKIKIIYDESDETTSEIMAKTLMEFGSYFKNNDIDLLIVLGDRYEIYAACIAAMNSRIPIAHLHGGEVTEGAMDDAMRHCITKMSALHFTSTETYKKRVIQLGEAPEKVFNVGAICVDNIRKQKLLSKFELEENIKIELGDKYAVATYHPVTLDNNNVREEIETLVKAMLLKNDYKYIITKANADEGGNIVNKYLDEIKNQYSDRLLVVDSLGMLRYLTALKYCKFVIGNSSSGIIEAPVMGIPTINIGTRQKGRLRCDSIIDIDMDEKQIIKAIELAETEEMQKKAENNFDIYGSGNTAEKIVEIIKKEFKNDGINIVKKFYDINQE